MPQLSPRSAAAATAAAVTAVLDAESESGADSRAVFESLETVRGTASGGVRVSQRRACVWVCAPAADDEPDAAEEEAAAAAEEEAEAEAEAAEAAAAAAAAAAAEAAMEPPGKALVWVA